MSLCKELNGHELDYDGHDVSDEMRIPMEKVQQFVGITYGYPVRGVSILCFLLTIALILFSFSQVFATMSVCGTLDTGFLCDEALLHGVETRTSSLIRVLRDNVTLQAIGVGVDNLFPSGEDAGFAGG
jgi:hypothetical protein